MLKLENSIRGLSFSRVAFDLTIQASKKDKVFLHELLRELVGERKVVLRKDLITELKSEYDIDYSSDPSKFLEHCTRGGLEYNRVTGEIVESRVF